MHPSDTPVTYSHVQRFFNLTLNDVAELQHKQISNFAICLLKTNRYWLNRHVHYIWCCVARSGESADFIWVQKWWSFCWCSIEQIEQQLHGKCGRDMETHYPAVVPGFHSFSNNDTPCGTCTTWCKHKAQHPTVPSFKLCLMFVVILVCLVVMQKGHGCDVLNCTPKKSLVCQLVNPVWLCCFLLCFNFLLIKFWSDSIFHLYSSWLIWCEIVSFFKLCLQSKRTAVCSLGQSEGL